MEQTIIPPPDKIIFSQEGYFYDMISSFMVAITGLEAIFNCNNPMNYQPKVVYTFEGKVHKEIRVEPHSIHEQALKGKITSSNVVNHLCNMLMNTAYESVKGMNDKSQEFEFFRHIRNASSHKNEFNFFNYEPAREASWRGKVIDSSKKGNSNLLFGKPCFGDFLGTADCILLLWDIEQKIS